MVKLIVKLDASQRVGFQRRVSPRSKETVRAPSGQFQRLLLRFRHLEMGRRSRRGPRVCPLKNARRPPTSGSTLASWRLRRFLRMRVYERYSRHRRSREFSFEVHRRQLSVRRSRSRRGDGPLAPLSRKECGWAEGNETASSWWNVTTWTRTLGRVCRPWWHAGMVTTWLSQKASCFAYKKSCQKSTTHLAVLFQSLSTINEFKLKMLND